MIVTVGRWVLTLGLLGWVWTGSRVALVLVLFLLMLANEMAAYNTQRRRP